MLARAVVVVVPVTVTPTIGPTTVCAPTTVDLFMPLSGKVLEVNKDIDNAPESVNNDPYTKGWMIKISIDNAAEVEELLSCDAYKALIGA